MAAPGFRDRGGGWADTCHARSAYACKSSDLITLAMAVSFEGVTTITSRITRRTGASVLTGMAGVPRLLLIGDSAETHSDVVGRERLDRHCGSARRLPQTRDRRSPYNQSALRRQHWRRGERALHATSAREPGSGYRSGATVQKPEQISDLSPRPSPIARSFGLTPGIVPLPHTDT